MCICKHAQIIFIIYFTIQWQRSEKKEAGLQTSLRRNPPLLLTIQCSPRRTPKWPNSKPHWATRQQAIANTPAKWSVYQIPSVIVVWPQMKTNSRREFSTSKSCTTLLYPLFELHFQTIPKKLYYQRHTITPPPNIHASLMQGESLIEYRCYVIRTWVIHCHSRSLPGHWPALLNP
jgi:hypothetical protein